MKPGISTESLLYQWHFLAQHNSLHQNFRLKDDFSISWDEAGVSRDAQSSHCDGRQPPGVRRVLMVALGLNITMSLLKLLVGALSDPGGDRGWHA